MDEEIASQLDQDLVTDLLTQFQSHHAPGSKKSPEPPKSQLAVEIPSISNSDEYDFLPGHFDVRCIIGEATATTMEPLYRVKLRSGEIELVSSSRLENLNNGPEALSHFRNRGQVYESSSQFPSHMGSSSSEDKDAPPVSRSDRLQRRSTRARNTGFTGFFNRMSSADEDSRSGSPSSDDIIISSTATTRNKRLRRLKRREARSKGSDMDSDFSLETKGSRFSTRQRKTLRSNLRERYEGDISENEELHKTQKFFGAKELFYKVPLDDEFRLRHSETCEACYRSGDDYAKGPLVFCQGCTSAYHQACLGPRATREHLVTKVADDLFVLQCRRCLGVARAKDAICPHQGCCTVCNIKGTISEPLRERLSPKQEQQLRQENEGKDPVANVDMARMNNADNLLFRCTACHRAFHFEHLIPESEATFQCQDCASAPGEISAMIAWRPRDPKTYVTGYTADIIEEIDKEYLIKWKGMSYNHTTWMPGSWVWGVVSPIMRRAFFKSNKSLNPHMTAEEAIPEDFLRADIVFDVKYADEGNDDSSVDRSLETDMSRVDRVTKAYIKYKGLAYEDAVWDSPPDRDKTERWADFQAAYEDWVKRDYTYMPDQQSLKKHLDQVRKQNFKSSIVKDTQPETLTGGQLMDYQKDGLNWLYYMWFKQQNAILADEMGLGKTIQIIGLFATLIQYHKCWPFLVVVPNSTCPNWRKEIKAWAPSIRVVTYYGSSFARQLAHKYEMFNEGSRDLRCHVVVTSYETMSDDASRRVLAKIPWAGLVVDEGQRLKNDKSRLYESLSRIRFPSKILLTGTPLQNNIRELFNLLQFCDPTKNAEKLENEYGVLSKENIPELHDMIRPFFLRRTKTQVLNFLPPVVQIIVPVSMSVVQKKLYKSILSKNPQLIKAIFQRNDKQGLKQTERHNLNNILMQLRKCLCHPFIYSQAIEERIANAAVSHRHLVEAAGKLQLLDIMLPKLKERGHRVLIFSQFLDNLDVVEDFLDGLGLQHRRLDGRMTSLEKQKMIDQYNAEDSPYFAFLLSTRSGGVGINLATADTVIIMDPDFNPHQDMQALSRAHRIGQKNKVLVFQLMTRGSAEEKIMQIGKKKMVLDHVLIDRMVSEEDDGQDLESILRHGAQALFEDDDSGDIRYDSASVDKLLDRSQAETALSPDENAPESQFSFARVWANDNQNLSDLQDTEEAVPDSAVWEKILQEREEAAAEEARKAETFGRGKRKRATVDYASNTAADLSPVKTPRKQDAESDIEFKAGDVVVSESEAEVIPELEPEEIERPLKKAKVHHFERVQPITDTDLASSAASMDGYMEYRPSCLACKQNHPVGSCRLKLAGVERCGLCGLAHFGHSRTCPHLQSDTQVALMLDALKQSTEDPGLVFQAKKYLSGIRGDLAQRKKKQASKATGGLSATHGTPSATPTALNATATRSLGVDPTNGNVQLSNQASQLGMDFKSPSDH